MIDPAGRVVHEIDVALPRDEVFAFLTDARRLVRWIGLSASLTAVPGGAFRFEIQPGQFCEGAYVDVAPPEFVSFTWGWTDPAWHLPPGSSLVSVTLTPSARGTMVRLTHDRLPGDLRAIHDEGWMTFLARLQAAAVGADIPA
ncbi:MAG TPA: SRPBCC family protein, partial [Streptosporangiaceae bacterium]